MARRRSDDFNLFGYGRAGLPDEVDGWFTPLIAEKVAADIVANIEVRGDRRRRAAGDDATMAWMLIAWHFKHGLKPAPIVLEAMAAAMGLISSDNRAPTPAAAVKRRLGFPAIEMWRADQWLLAARLDGEADAGGGAHLLRDALGEALGVAPRSIDSWRKSQPYRDRRRYAAAIYRGSAPLAPRGLAPQLAWIAARRGADSRQRRGQ